MLISSVRNETVSTWVNWDDLHQANHKNNEGNSDNEIHPPEALAMGHASALLVVLDRMGASVMLGLWLSN